MATISSALGLARRAGKCVLGTQACLKAIRSGKACLVVLDSGTGYTTRSQIEAAAEACKAPLRILDPSVRLEDAVGKANARVAVIIDPGFLGLFRDIFEPNNTETHGGAEKE